MLRSLEPGHRGRELEDAAVLEYDASGSRVDLSDLNQRAAA